MEEIEVAILITVVLLLLLSVVSMVMYGRRGRGGYSYENLTHPVGCRCSVCVGAYEQYSAAPDLDNKPLLQGDWQEQIQDVGIDNATKFSHKQYKEELLAKTTGSSPWSVIDHDLDSNWLGLGWGKTYRQVYAQEGARVSESVDHQDMPSNPNIRWRCHEYIDSKQDNTGAGCPWPPVADQKYM